MVNRVLQKLVENPGRIFFLRGAYMINPKEETVPDSFSVEYYLMIQQKSRLQLIQTVQSVDRRKLWKLPWLAILFIKRFVQLKMTNTLVQSYLQESLLMKQALHELQSKNSAT